MKAGFCLVLGVLVQLAVFPPEAFSNESSGELRLPEAALQFDVNTGRRIDHVSVSITCLRKATFFEYVNNGGDNFASCDRLAVEPDSIDREPLERINDTTFRFPAAKMKFARRKGATLCLKIRAHFRPGDMTEHDLHTVPENANSALSFCSRDTVPKFFPNAYTFRNLYHFEDFEVMTNHPIKVFLKK